VYRDSAVFLDFSIFCNKCFLEDRWRRIGWLRTLRTLRNESGMSQE